jgi:hypothetical protein
MYRLRLDEGAEAGQTGDLRDAHHDQLAVASAQIGGQLVRVIG